MNVRLGISLDVDGGVAEDEQWIRDLATIEARKLAAAMADRLEEAGVHVEIQAVEEP